MKSISGKQKLGFALLVGMGYPVGVLISTSIMRILHAIGNNQDFSLIVVCLFLVGTICFGFLFSFNQFRLHGLDNGLLQKRMKLELWQVVLLGVVIILLGARISLLYQEISLRPLFPWDAWDAWVPRTLEYFGSGTLQTELNTIKKDHGLLVNLVHLFTMLGANSYDSPLVNLPWLLVTLSLVIGFFGFCKSSGIGVFTGILASYLLLSLPYLNIHTMLSGYSDIWVTAFFSLGTIAAAESRERHQFIFVGFAMVCALLCYQSKRAGMGMSVILLLTILYSIVRWNKIRGLIVAGSVLLTTALIVGALVGLYSIEVNLPWYDVFRISSTEIVVPSLGNFGLNYSELNFYPFFESTMIYASWHLLFYVFFATIAVVCYRRLWQGFFDPVFISIVSSLLYFYVFHGLIAAKWLSLQTGLSRSVLYITPLIIWWCVKWYSVSRGNETMISELVEDRRGYSDTD